MLGNRDGLESGDIGSSRKRILIESLRFLKERNEEEFEKYKQELEGTDLWKTFQREYGD